MEVLVPILDLIFEQEYYYYIENFFIIIMIEKPF